MHSPVGVHPGLSCEAYTCFVSRHVQRSTHRYGAHAKMQSLHTSGRIYTRIHKDVFLREQPSCASRRLFDTVSSNSNRHASQAQEHEIVLF